MTTNNTANDVSIDLHDDHAEAFGLVQSDISNAFTEEDKSQDTKAKPKSGRGRPKKDDPEKREPVLMLRMNEAEREKLDELIYKHGWTGDKASFVRELILRKKPRSKGDLGLHAVDALATSALPIINHFLTDVALGKADRELIKSIRQSLTDTSKYIRENAK